MLRAAGARREIKMMMLRKKERERGDKRGGRRAATVA